MTSDALDIQAAMKRIRRTLEARIRAADRRERAPAARRKADGALAAYDTAALGRALRPALEWDGRGWRALAAEIGVTSPDLSRIMAGQDISCGKVFAICDWLGVDPRKFYRPVKGKRARFRGPRRVPSSASRAAGAGSLVERAAGAAAGRRTIDGGQSAAEGACFTGNALKREGAES